MPVISHHPSICTEVQPPMTEMKTPPPVCVGVILCACMCAYVCVFIEAAALEFCKHPKNSFRGGQHRKKNSDKLDKKFSSRCKLARERDCLQKWPLCGSSIKFFVCQKEKRKFKRLAKKGGEKNMGSLFRRRPFFIVCFDLSHWCGGLMRACECS